MLELFNPRGNLAGVLLSGFRQTFPSTPDFNVGGMQQQNRPLKNEHSANIEIGGDRGPPTFLEPGWQLPSPDVVFPTFTRGVPKQKPPPFPAGLNRIAAHEKERWKNDK